MTYALLTGNRKSYPRNSKNIAKYLKKIFFFRTLSARGKQKAIL
jgi:hypothetical protein